jgi:uncharacterized membrane protein
VKVTSVASAIGIPGAVLAGNAARGPSLMPWPNQVRRVFPLALGALTGIGLSAVTVATVLGSRVMRGHVSGTKVGRSLALGATVVGAGYAAFRLRKQFLSSLFAEGRSIEPAFAEPPTSPCVSGSAASVVPLPTLGREGARFVHAATTHDDVNAVHPAVGYQPPIRIFIGFDAAATISDRVALALAEMDRTGAWDRSTLLLLAPAGTGYANSAPVDALEILTQGDCATVVVGYGLLPSFLSLDRTDVGALTQRRLMTAITERGFAGRLLLYGESLGARVQQAAIDVRELGDVGIDRVLWVGTPGGADVPDEMCVRLDHPADLAERDAMVWLLEHAADPVVRFTRQLAWQRPPWLSPEVERGRNVPEDMVWRPGVTYAQVLIDTLFATDIRAGDFQSLGHDYRADLAAITSAAFGFGIDDQRNAALDERLRLLEMARAARIDGNPHA